MRRLMLGIVLSLAAATATAQAVNVTGTWNGNYELIDHCTGGRTLTARGVARATLTQAGATVWGVIVFEDLLLANNEESCAPGQPDDFPVGIMGTVTGGALDGILLVPDDEESIRVIAPVTATSINISFPAQPVTSGSITLSRVSSQPPDSRLSGTYTGTYTRSERANTNDPAHPGCLNLTGSVSSSGPFTLGFFQSGTFGFGVGTLYGAKTYLDDGHGNCSIVTEDLQGSTFGTIDGNVFTQHSTNDRGDVDFTLTFTFNGDAVSGDSQASDGSETETFTATRTSSGAPTIVTSFDVEPRTINAGDSAVLSWSTINATAVSIDNGIGSQPGSGSVTVKPAITTAYKLTATGPGGTATATLTLGVNSGPPARIALGSPAHGMVQTAGAGGATDSFALTNVGGSAANVTLSSSGDFFTVSPSSFTLGAGAAQTVTITGTAQPAGFYEGSVRVNGTGISIPIRLLSAMPPGEAAQVTPTVTRADVPAPAGQNPSGTVSFTNRGNRPLPAIAVSDQPWIIPESGVITVQPGETKAVAFNIDSSKRPGGAEAIGGTIGKISLVFPTGTAAGKNAVAAGTSTGSVSVTLVHVVTPPVSQATPPALAPGELALFVPGIANQPRALGDLLIANKSSNASASDLKVYFQAAGASAQVTNLPQIQTNTSIALPGLARNVFSSAAQTGTAQIRGADLSKVTVSAIQVNPSATLGTVATALPVLRSDRGVGAGGRIVISGVFAVTGAVQTDLFVQELTGTSTTVRVEALAEDGTVISTRPEDSLPPFGLLAVPNAAPENTTALRITNTSSGGAKIGAYGIVIHQLTGDGWTISDPVAGAETDDVLILPLASAGTGAQTFFFGTNRTATPTTVALDIRRTGKRRAISTAHGGTANAVTSFTLLPYETVLGPVKGTGYVRVGAAPGTMSAVGRSVVEHGPTVLGIGIPALPVSAALASGQSRRFAGVEDGTSKTSLILIGAAGSDATVRVTLRYALVAGVVSAIVMNSKNYALHGEQMLQIPQIVRDVIGPVRDSFGDLHNVQLDVEVTGGSGRVLPYLQSTDSASGDSIMRIE